MKNIPKQIFLQVDPDDEQPEDYNELKGITFSIEQINKTDIEYVRKDLINVKIK